MKIATIGTGLEGLVAAACLAERGNDVTCADADAAKIAHLHTGVVPEGEPELEAMIGDNLEAGRLAFTTRIAASVRASHVVVIAVPVPLYDDGSQDVSLVLDVAALIGAAMNDDKVVVLLSPAPVGTAERARRTIETETEFGAHMAVLPLLLEQGRAVRSFLEPERVVLGAGTEYAACTLRDLWAGIVPDRCPVLVMDVTSAEITRSAASAMLATRLSLMSKVARLCERTGADPDAVRRGVGSGYPRTNGVAVGREETELSRQVRALQRMLAEGGVDPEPLEIFEAPPDDSLLLGRAGDGALPGALRYLRAYAMCAQSTRIRGRRRVHEQKPRRPEPWPGSSVVESPSASVRAPRP